MVGSTNIASHSSSHHQQSRNQPMDGADHHHNPDVAVVDENDPPLSGVFCSICLDSVTDNAVRSIAKLQCGHQFHLDCIGSAFNIKGSMQCPNCRKVENGQWLFANGSTPSVPEMRMDEWILSDDFSEMPYRFHWCPYGELAHVGSSFEEVDSPSTAFAHSYVALVGPIPPNSSRSNDSIDDPNFNQQWSGQSVRQEIFGAHAFPAINIPFNGWGRRSPSYTVSSGHVNGIDPASVPLTFRSSNGETDARTRSTPFPHPVLFGHGSGPLGGSSFVSSIVPRHPGSSVGVPDRIQISHGFHHRQQAGVPSPIIHGVRRFDGPRGLPALVPPPPPPQHDHSGGFLIIPPASSAQPPQEAENHFLQHVTFERDPNWGSFHQNGNRPTGFWHRHSP